MSSRIEDNRRFLSDLFAGTFRGHGIIMDPELPPADWPSGDAAISEKPLEDWLPLIVRNYEISLKWHEALGDDSVPYARLWTGTEVFAAAFGCPVQIYPDNAPCALPIVTSAKEADRLPMPDLTARPLKRIFKLGQLLREELGPDVPIGVPDIQSPFDIAALIWRKEDLFVAMYEEPDAVKRLVAKCHSLLASFLAEFKEQFPNCNLCHCPKAWAPPELGCWLSEDEVGSISAAAFEEFCLPGLSDLSREFGGIFMHCCASADHQYNGFRMIPNLRGINRVFQAPGPAPAIQAFAGRTVLVIAWTGQEDIHKMLDMALPDSRFLFNIPAMPLDEAKRTYKSLRERCPRC